MSTFREQLEQMTREELLTEAYIWHIPMADLYTNEELIEMILGRDEALAKAGAL